MKFPSFPRSLRIRTPRIRRSRSDQSLAEPIVVWLRRDLRVTDHQALSAAAASAEVVCVYVHEEQPMAGPVHGPSARAFLRGALEALQESLADRGVRLVLKVAPAGTGAEVALTEVAGLVGASKVVYTHMYEPSQQQEDERVCAALHCAGIRTEGFHGYLLHDAFHMEQVARDDVGLSGLGSLQHMEQCVSHLPEVGEPLAPPKLVGAKVFASVSVRELNLCSDADYDRILAHWAPSEIEARQRMNRFVHSALENFKTNNVRADLLGKESSTLSPYLYWGLLSPRVVYTAAKSAAVEWGIDVEPFLQRLLTRDMAYLHLRIFPDMARKSIKASDETPTGEPSKEVLVNAWKTGRTGYPLVDAGLVELRTTGFMSPPLREVTASFLTRFCRVDWRVGFRHFQEHLVDADEAIGALAWQTAAGTALVASDVLDPVLAARKCDVSGDYTRKWIPALAQVSAKYVHCPWEVDPRQGPTHWPRVLVEGSPTKQVSDADRRATPVRASSKWSLRW